MWSVECGVMGCVSVCTTDFSPLCIAIAECGASVLFMCILCTVIHCVNVLRFTVILLSYCTVGTTVYYYAATMAVQRIQHTGAVAVGDFCVLVPIPSAALALGSWRSRSRGGQPSTCTCHDMPMLVVLFAGYLLVLLHRKW